MDLIRRAPSPALVVAVLALVLALAGAAIAGPSALERALTKTKVKTIARNEARKAVAAGAPAFAQIDQNGVVSAANSSGICGRRSPNAASLVSESAPRLLVCGLSSSS